MKSNSLNDQNMELLAKALDLHAAKEKVIASNIANSETPGFSPVKYTFRDELSQAIDKNSFSVDRTNPSHIPITIEAIDSVSGTYSQKPDTTNIGDLNGVSLDQEMLDLSENQLRYETAVQLLKKKMTILKYVVQGGGQ